MTDVDPASFSAMPADFQRRAVVSAFRRLNALRRSIGPRYAQCNLDNWEFTNDPRERNEQQAVLARIHEFAEELPDVVKSGSGLFLHGPSGTGKDHLLAAVMLNAACKGYWVNWQNGLDFAATARDAVTESEMFKRLTRPSILGLSDPPSPRDLTTVQRALMLRAIDDRYRRRKPTWITVNAASLAEVRVRFGHELVERLMEGSLCLGCNWGSFRQSRPWIPNL